MLTEVEVRTTQGTLLNLPLDQVSSGIFIEDIDGLDPVKATLVSSSFAQMDGEQYHSSRREKRNIILRLGIEPDYTLETVQNVRERLYEFFMPKSNVKLRFYNSNGLVVEIQGRVESLETPIFVKEPRVDISIICFSPDFLALDPVVLLGNTVSDNTDMVISYLGTVETGIELVLNIDRALTEFTIYHTPPSGEIRTFDFAAPLQAGDVLTTSTIFGAKGITLLRGGTLTSVLYGFSPQSNWISLEKGDNLFRVYAVGDPIPYEISYTTRYGGL